MKKIDIPRPRPTRTFPEKFGREVAFFGSRERREPPRLGPIPFLITCALSGLALVAAVLLLGRLWKVSEVTAADGHHYTAALICESAAIEPGCEMLGFDASAVERRLRRALPLLDDIRIRKHINGRVSITVTEETELYYTRHNVNYYILSADDMEVLGVFSTDEEARRVGATYLGLPESARVRVGEKLSFVNLPYAPESAPQEWTTYEVETEEPTIENAYVLAFIEALHASALSDRVVGMDLSDRYDLLIVLDGHVRVQIGTMQELERKLTLVQRTLEADHAPVPDGMVTLVDVSDPARIVYRASPDVKLPVWGS